MFIPKLCVLLLGMMALLPTLSVAADAGAAAKAQESRVEQTAARYGPENEKTCAARRDLADIYEEQGCYEAALPLREKIADWYGTHRGVSEPDTWDVFQELAVNYLEQGRVDDALPLQEKILDLRRRFQGKEHPDTAGAIVNLATIYNRLGRCEEAMPLYERALSVLMAARGERSMDTLACMNNLACTYKLAGRAADSLEWSEKVLRLTREVMGDGDRNTLGAMANLADTYRELGYADKAVKMSRQVWELSRAALGEKHPDTISAMVNLAVLYDDAGQWEDALSLQRQALTLSEPIWGKTHPNTIDSLIKTANLLQKLGREEEAIELGEKAVVGVEALRGQGVLSPEDRQHLFARFGEVYRNLAELYREDQRPAQAFHMLELSKARTLLECSTARLADQSGILTAGEAEQIRRYEVAVSRLNERIARKYDSPEEKVALETEKGQILQKAGDFRQALMAKYPKYAQLNEVSIVDAQDGRDLIPADAVFINWLVRQGKEVDERLVSAFVLDGEGNLNSLSLGNFPHFDETLAAYSQALQGKWVWRLQDGSYCRRVGDARPEQAVAFADAAELSAWLGERLLKPLQGQIGERSHWIIAVDGALAFVPLETMAVDGETVLDRHDVSYVQSLSMLRLIADRQQEYQKLDRRQEIFAMGAAEYSDETTGSEKRSGMDKKTESGAVRIRRSGLPTGGEKDAGDIILPLSWQNLPTSASELDQLAAIFGSQAVIYRGREASEDKLWQLDRAGSLAQYRYMLFSTHGYFCLQEPALSSIILNQVHRTKERDGYVTAVKWPAYHLQSDLMFLSACETGLGKVMQGEGITGLPFAFYVAGNTNTVFTLWKVVDESSTAFTKAFFAKIQQGESQCRALNEVKREMKADSRYGKPLFWAPYVLYGV